MPAWPINFGYGENVEASFDSESILFLFFLKKKKEKKGAGFEIRGYLQPNSKDRLSYIFF